MTYNLTGKIAQQLTACTRFTEDLSLTSSTHIQQFTIAYNSSYYLRQSNPLVLHRQLCKHIHAYTKTHTF